MPPYFSIVIPTFNRSETIRPTLDSVRTQTYGNFECLIIDDGSDDVENLEKIVNGINDSRFRIIRRENGGGGAARNTGIENSSGSYIAFLDSDDLFNEEKLQKCFELLEAQHPKAIYSYASVDRGIEGKKWIRPDRPIALNESMASYLFIANQFVQTSTIIMKAEVAKAVLFDPSLRKGQDLDFCLRADIAGVQFQMLEESLVTWTDINEHGRTSRHAGVSAPEAWLAAHSHLMNPKEIMGYRATVLSYYQPKYRFILVLRDLILGVAVAKVPAKVALRQWLRFSLPKRAYRNLVNFVVSALH